MVLLDQDVQVLRGSTLRVARQRAIVLHLMHRAMRGGITVQGNRVFDLADVDTDFAACRFFTLTSGCTTVASLGFIARLAFPSVPVPAASPGTLPSCPDKFRATQFSNCPPN